MNFESTHIADLLETPQDSKDRLINTLQAQLRDVRQDAQDVKHMLLITEAKLEESRRVLDRFMEYRS